MSDSVRARVEVSGRVQGVFFRATTAEKAAEAGVGGWVRNTSAGTVEAVFEGPREAVERMIRWCHDGPDWASVDRVDVTWERSQGEREFRVR